MEKVSNIFFASRDNHELEFPFWVKSVVEETIKTKDFEIIDCRESFSECLVIAISKSNTNDIIVKIFDYVDFLTFIELP